MFLFSKRNATCVSISLIFLIFVGSIEAQNQWTLQKRVSNIDLNTVAFANNENGWIGGDKGLLLRTQDSGNTWIKYSINTTQTINEVYFRNENNGFILAGDRLFMMIDGADWKVQKIFDPKNFPGSTIELYSIRFSDKKRGWIVGSINKDDVVVDSLLLKTEDSGTTWNRVLVPTKVELIHLDFVNENKGWIVGEKGTILATEDAGGTWIAQTTKTDATIYSVDFRNDKEGIGVGSKGLILRTEDGGKNWINATTKSPNTLWRVAFPDDKRSWVAGRNGTILFSSDKGKTWVKQTSNATENLFGFFLGKKQVWAVGAKGVVLSLQR
jgi:photosystem II stability/assembly factor-like uncharacterized protein